MFILSISENILNFIAGAGTLQGFLLAILLYLHPKSDHAVNKFLAVYIVCISIIPVTVQVQQLITWQKSFFMAPLPYLAGPLLYLYVRSLKETITFARALPHLAIFFLYFFISYWHFSMMSSFGPESRVIPKEALRHPVTITFILVRYAHMVLYYFLSRNVLSNYQKSIKHLFSETSRINFGWVRLIINGFLLVVVASLMLFPLILRFPHQVNLLMLMNMCIATPYIYLATLKGITQQTLWQTKPGINKEKLEKEIHEAEEIEMVAGNSEKSKVQKSILNDNKVDVIITKVRAAMELEKLYQESELTLQEVSDKIQFPSYQVSQAINEGMKKNFYDLINSYRVEEAKRLLHNPSKRNFTILSVGFEAGFNSKTTFNTVFKKFTGLTPTEFRDQQRTSVVS